MTPTPIQIMCELGNGNYLGLADIRENLGHDDSLPYQANIFIMDKDNCPKGSMAFKRIASIWNDGWGGESNIISAGLKDSEKYLKYAAQQLKKHQYYYRGKPAGSYDLGFTCDMMASVYLDAYNNKAYRAQMKRYSSTLYLFDDDERVLQNPDMFPLLLINYK